MRASVHGLLILAGLAALPVGASAQSSNWVQDDQAELRALDKITGRSTDMTLEVGSPVEFGSLRLDLKVCYQTPPEEAPESAAFLEVTSLTPMGEDVEPGEEPVIFSGWMFASSPGLNALEHPVYDVWVRQCREPDEVPSPDAPQDTEADDTAPQD